MSLHDGKIPQMDIAITATHNFSFNFGCLFYHVWLIKDSEQPHHRKATASGCPKALLHHTHEAIIVQGASFIYSHLAFRKKIPRGKLALKNTCTVSLSKGRYWFGVLGGFFSFFLFGLVLIFSHLLNRVWSWQSPRQWGAAPTLELWPPVHPGCFPGTEKKHLCSLTTNPAAAPPQCFTLFPLVYTTLDIICFSQHRFLHTYNIDCDRDRACAIPMYIV